MSKSVQHLTVHLPGSIACSNTPTSIPFTADIDPNAPAGPIVFEIIGTTSKSECSTLATVNVTEPELVQIQNRQTVRGTLLNDQVLNGTTAEFRADLSGLGGQAYYLRWTFAGVTSSWLGPYTTSPSGVYSFAVPPDRFHTLNDPLEAEVRIGVNGPVCDSMTRDMRVFFDIDGISDSHNYPGGNPDANWFRHWGFDHDGACTGYASSASMFYYGTNVTFDYGGHIGPSGLFGRYNNDRANPIITLFNVAHGQDSATYNSPAMTYADSQGNQVNAPAGAISIAYNRSGIDLMNHTIAHEVEHHHVNMLWDPVTNGLWFTTYGPRMKDDGDGVLEPGENDFDDDRIPNVVEDGLPGFIWANKFSHVPGFYLNGDDEEVWCEMAGVNAQPGNAANDWAFEGKQSTPSN